MAAADAGSSAAGGAAAAAGQQAHAVQEPGDRPHRPLPYRPWADVAVDRASGKVTCTLTNDGTVGFHFTVLPNIALPFTGTPFTVAPRSLAHLRVGRHGDRRPLRLHRARRRRLRPPLRRHGRAAAGQDDVARPVGRREAAARRASRRTPRSS